MTELARKKKDLKSFISEDFLKVSESQTVGETVSWLKAHKQDFQNKFTYLYAVNSRGKLVGVLRVRDLLIEDSEASISKTIKQEVDSISEDSSLESALKIFCLRSFLAIPVISENGELIGVIERKKIEKYLTPEIKQRFSSVSEREEVEEHKIHEIILKRLPWLLISVTSGLACAYILGLFIGKVESIVALILFIPIILGIAGNVGTQAARVMGRDLEAGRLSVKTLGVVLIRDFVFGMSLGFIALVNSLIISSLMRKSPIVGIALGSSITTVTAISALLGSFLPVVLRFFRIKTGPASGLFILLICDMVALILYFMIFLTLVDPGLELS